MHDPDLPAPLERPVEHAASRLVDDQREAADPDEKAASRRQMRVSKFSARAPVYQNCKMLSADGSLLCHCDIRKLKWYQVHSAATYRTAMDVQPRRLAALQSSMVCMLWFVTSTWDELPCIAANYSLPWQCKDLTAWFLQATQRKSTALTDIGIFVISRGKYSARVQVTYHTQDACAMHKLYRQQIS